MANLPYDRFQKCLCQLAQLGMISNVETGKFFVTEKGSEYVQEFERINDFLRHMGLSSEI
jgi:predicted transcriptional regulator